MKIFENRASHISDLSFQKEPVEGELTPLALLGANSYYSSQFKKNPKCHGNVFSPLVRRGLILPLDRAAIMLQVQPYNVLTS